MAQFTSLSKREWEVVKLLLQGKSNKLIASSLGISNRTVEFHLKNIYAKFQVSSRVELILKLGNATGKAEIEKLGYSTVDNRRRNAENRDTPDPRTNRVTSFRDAVSIIGRELEMKNLLSTRHVPAGVITALFTGFFWVALLKRFGHMSLDAIKPWILPLVVILALIGLSIGLIGKRNGNISLKVFFSTLFGTGFAAFAMIPLVGFVVYPLAKLIEWLGLFDRAMLPNDVASTLIYVAMLITWLVVGVLVGTTMLHIVIKRPGNVGIQTHASEHSL